MSNSEKVIKFSKVLMIGIDALDSNLLLRFEKELPNFREMKRSPNIISKSIFPPDTPTAWASIYTGLNPARHGVLLFVDPLDRITTLAFQGVNNELIRGKTFWDYAGRSGKKVCILFPELGYPVWPTNGVMVGRSARFDKDAPIQAFPASLRKKYDLSRLSRVIALPKRKLFPIYIEAHRNLVLAETEFGIKMWKEGNWDLFFIFSTSLDWVGHSLWPYFDEDDPSYPGANQYENVMLDFYRLYDEMIARFLAVADPDTTVIVFSDHGQCRRPLKLLNINEILRRMGLLVPKIKKPSWKDPYYMIEKLKRQSTKFISEYGVGKILARLVHAFPTAKRFYTSPVSIDWRKTSAYVTDLSGIKAYSYGGIMIERKNLRALGYEETRTLLIRKLGEVKESDGKKKLVKWICRREELYQGEHISKYPDIVLHLRDEYGIGWEIYQPIVSSSYTHSIQPGCHSMDSPEFLMTNTGERRPVRGNISLMDIAPTVLDLLGIEENFGFDGESIFLRKGRCQPN